jgi:hypothetical protein
LGDEDSDPDSEFAFSSGFADGAVEVECGVAQFGRRRGAGQRDVVHAGGVDCVIRQGDAVEGGVEGDGAFLKKVGVGEEFEQEL